MWNAVGVFLRSNGGCRFLFPFLSELERDFGLMTLCSPARPLCRFARLDRVEERKKIALIDVIPTALAESLLLSVQSSPVNMRGRSTMCSAPPPVPVSSCRGFNSTLKSQQTCCILFRSTLTAVKKQRALSALFYILYIPCRPSRSTWSIQQQHIY